MGMSSIPKTRPTSNLATSAQFAARSVLTATVAPDSRAYKYATFVPTATQQTALKLYRLGLNVFPQPLGSKKGFAWRRLQTTRLFHDENDLFNPDGLLTAFVGRCNTAVMCGHTSDNLTIMENDDPALTESLIRHWQRLDLPPLYGVKSSKGVHLYFHAPYEMANVSLNGLDVWGNSHYALTEGSRIADARGNVTHIYQRFGDASEPPHLTMSQIADLAYTFDDGQTLHLVTRAQGKPRKVAGFNPSTIDYIEHGDQLKDWKKRRFFWAACDHAGNGYSLSATADILKPIGRRSNPPLSEKVMDGRLKSAFSKPRNVGRVIPAWKRAELAFQTKPFTGHHWQVRRLTKTVEALLKRSQHGTQRNGAFRATYGELQDMTGLGINQQRRAIKELIDLGIIEYALSDSVSGGNCYKWNEKWLNVDTLTPKGLKLDTSTVSSMRQNFSHDVLKALQSGATIYDAMLSTVNALTISEIAMLAGVSRATVNRHVNKDSLLVSAGFVYKVGRKWRADPASNEVLEEGIARPANTLGDHQRQVNRRASNRAKYATRVVIRARWNDANPDTRAEFQALVKEIVGNMPQGDVSTIVENAADLSKSNVISTRGDVSTNVDVTTNVISTDSTAFAQLNKPTSTHVTAIPTADTLALWVCPNCTQQYFGSPPPDMCAYCDDFTTWKPRNDAAFIQSLATEFGAVVTDAPARTRAENLIKPETPAPENTQISTPPAAPPVTSQQARYKNQALDQLRLITPEQFKANSQRIAQWECEKNRAAWTAFYYAAVADIEAHHAAKKLARAAAKSNSRKANR